MGLALVKDLRELRAPLGAEQIEQFETDVLARAAAGLADSTIRNDTGNLELIRSWFGRPAGRRRQRDADARPGRRALGDGPARQAQRPPRQGLAPARPKPRLVVRRRSPNYRMSRSWRVGLWNVRVLTDDRSDKFAYRKVQKPGRVRRMEIGQRGTTERKVPLKQDCS